VAEILEEISSSEYAIDHRLSRFTRMPLLRSWLRPHRGISQEKLPLYLGFFEFVHNVRKRGKALLGALIELLVS